MSVEVRLPIRKTKKGAKHTYNTSPFMDIEFHIDTTGKVDKFHLSNFNPENNWNKQFQKELFDEGVRAIKDLTDWESGKILGQKVNTIHNIRVSFN